MKILFVNTGISVGGAEKSMVFVADSIAEKGHDVTFLTYRDDDISCQPGAKVRYEHIKLEDKGGSIKQMLSTVFFLHKYIKNHRFDIAVAFLSPSQLRLILAATFTKTKVVVSQRGDPYNTSGSAFDFFFKRLFRSADGLVFQTENAMKFYGKKTNKKSVVIPNPCQPLKRTKPVNEREHIITTASRLDLKQKRQDVLISAFNIFSKENQDYKLYIFGDGEDKPEIEKLAQSNPNIKLMGVTTDIAVSIQESTFFVLTSDYEGIPNALIEAMSLGLPCISTKCSPGGAEFLIEDGASGLLVERGDINGLAKAMKRLADDGELRAVLSKNAIYVNEKFKPETIAKEWEDFLIGIMRYEK